MNNDQAYEREMEEQIQENLKKWAEQLRLSEETMAKQAKRDETQERIADALEEIAAVLHDIACTYEGRGTWDSPLFAEIKEINGLVGVTKHEERS